MCECESLCNCWLCSNAEWVGRRVGEESEIVLHVCWLCCDAEWVRE